MSKLNFSEGLQVVGLLLGAVHVFGDKDFGSDSKVLDQIKDIAKSSCTVTNMETVGTTCQEKLAAIAEEIHICDDLVDIWPVTLILAILMYRFILAPMMK